jgi:hypothetical protein
VPDVLAIFCRRRFGTSSRPCPLNHGFSLSKQKADNPGDNEVENRAYHHAAHSAEQHEDVGLTKQHPDHQSPDEGAKDAGEREALGKPNVTSLTHLIFWLKALTSSPTSKRACAIRL